ncbi:outer membrane protein [Rhodohalobacter sp. SW132]|uniref:outer membrane protein n=1 Tax=Rhodohalobacter sp. SW132 TaxID=2293433 RepID=UPI001315ABA4|nr:outer membrane beta-barrel protein [Rhodohalobacter sp. SW132]
MKRTLFVLFSGILFLPLFLTDTADAQWSIGASYEVRDEDPTNGFGVRLERSVLSSVPIVDLGIRAHFSYFNETNSLTTSGATIERDFESLDFGFAGTGEVSVGLVSPYVGLGIGWDNSSLEYSENISESSFDVREEFDTTDFYWNAFVGARVSIIPMVSPFIEYRFSQVSGREDVNLDNINRLALGVSLRF